MRADLQALVDAVESDSAEASELAAELGRKYGFVNVAPEAEPIEPAEPLPARSRKRKPAEGFQRLLDKYASP